MKHLVSSFVLVIFFIVPVRVAVAQDTIHVKAGWNLMSLPLNVSDGATGALFPTASSKAYIYQHGYVAKEILEKGAGFWLKFNADTTVVIAGKFLFGDTIQVTKGWNIVGALTKPIAVNSIRPEPAGIVSSPFYSYTPGGGYQQTDTLRPGLGYWVKTSDNASLILSWKGFFLNDSTKQPESLPNFTGVTVDSMSLTLTYASASDLPALSPGDILVGNSEGGYVRRVVSSSANGNQLIVTTGAASFDEVVDLGRVDTTYDITFPDLATLNRLLGKSIRSEGNINGEAYLITASAPMIMLSPDARLLTLKFANFSVEFGSHASVRTDMLTFALEATIQSCNFEWNFGLVSARFVTQLKPTITFQNLKLVMSGLFEGTKEIPLIPAPIPLGVIPTPIPGLVLIPAFNLKAGANVSLTLEGGIETLDNVEIGGTLETGFEYVNGILLPVFHTGLFGSVNPTVTPDHSPIPILSFKGEASVYLQPSIDVSIEGVLGVGIYVKPYGYGKLTWPPMAAELGAGVSGGVSVGMKLFSKTVFDEDFPLADSRVSLSFTHGPEFPKNPTPDSAAIHVSTSPTLRWTCIEPDGDPLLYTIYFGAENPPTTSVSLLQSDASLPRSGLILDTTYFWRVEAYDNHGNSISSPVWSFTTDSVAVDSLPCPGIPTVEYAGKIYNTVKIGSQCWLRENLDVGTMRIGDTIGDSLEINNGTIEKFCYNDDPANCAIYGGLYPWREAMQYSRIPGAQGICPPGWHIPIQAEFATLFSRVGNDGNKLKAVGQGVVLGVGTNTSGFSALLGGIHGVGSGGPLINFWGLNQYAFFYTSEGWDFDFQNEKMYYEMLASQSGVILSGNVGGWPSGYSIRCIKN